SSVNVDADGLGVLNWGGQRAVGLIGDGAVRAYALVSGAESAALGQQDGPQWGGGGAALGGIVVGGLAGGLGAGAQETLTEDWVFNISPPKTVTVTSTVTKGLEGDPWTYKWEYHLVNHDF